MDPTLTKWKESANKRNLEMATALDEFIKQTDASLAHIGTNSDGSTVAHCTLHGTFFRVEIFGNILLHKPEPPESTELKEASFSIEVDSEATVPTARYVNLGVAVGFIKQVIPKKPNACAAHFVP